MLVILLIWQQVRLYQARQNAEKREELFQIITENAADMIALVDFKRKRHYNSPAYQRVLGYSPEELAGTNSFHQIHPDDRMKVLEAAREAQETGVGKRLQYRMLHKNGSWRFLESTASTIKNKKGEVEKLVVVNRDITERKLAEEKLEHNSLHDVLTGLPNRRLFVERLQRSFLQAQRNSEYHYAVLFLDLDEFEVFNDLMGPKVADQVIVEIARRLSECLRQNDTVARPVEGFSGVDTMLCRLGGDEFPVLLEGIPNPSDALRVAQRLQAAVAAPFVVEGHDIRASASVGIALNSAAHKQAEDLLGDAGMAMRRAKAQGRCRCEIFDAGMHSKAIHRLNLESELRAAIARRQLGPHFQPIVQMKTRQIVGFEALLRWFHPDRIVVPGEFIEVAEDTGLIVPIGQGLLQEACRQVVDWQARYTIEAPLCVSVKISARQFAHPGFVEDVKAALQETSLDPCTLHLEMTEGVAMLDPILSADILSQLKRLGVRIIVDHFGTGHMPLAYVRRFPLDGLKVDRMLVSSMLSDRASSDILRLIIHVAHKLNLQVMAEGIEEVAQVKHLLNLGCEIGQGYYFSKPCDSKQAEQALGRLRSQTPIRSTR